MPQGASRKGWVKRVKRVKMICRMLDKIATLIVITKMVVAFGVVLMAGVAGKVG